MKALILATTLVTATSAVAAPLKPVLKCSGNGHTIEIFTDETRELRIVAESRASVRFLGAISRDFRAPYNGYGMQLNHADNIQVAAQAVVDDDGTRWIYIMLYPLSGHGVPLKKLYRKLGFASDGTAAFSAPNGCSGEMTAGFPR